MLLGLCFGVGLFGATLYWIFLFGALAWTGARRALRRLDRGVRRARHADRAPRWRSCGPRCRSPPLWTAVDWIRGMWPLGGFTWGSLGTSQVDDRALVRLASVTGVWGVTFVVVLVNAAVRGRVARRGRAAVRVGLVGWPPWRRSSRRRSSRCPQRPAIRVDVAVVQVDVRRPADTSAGQEDLTVARRNIARIPDAREADAAARPRRVGGGGARPRRARRSRDGGGRPGRDPSGGRPDDRRRGAERPRRDATHRACSPSTAPGSSSTATTRSISSRSASTSRGGDSSSWVSAISQIPVDRTPGSGVHTVDAAGPPQRSARRSASRTPSRRSTATFVARRSELPRRPGQQRLVRVHRGVGPAPADEPDARGRDGAVGGATRRSRGSARSSTPTGRSWQHGTCSAPLSCGTPIRSSTASTVYVRCGDWLPVAAAA